MPLKERRLSNVAQACSELDSGLYVLLLRLDVPLALSAVGAMGEMVFNPGFYAYCGSARRNLSARIARHFARVKKARWHIDYLTCHREVRVESVRLFPFDGWTECRLNLFVQHLPHAGPIQGFGSSDCKCAAHLTFFGSNRPDLRFDKNSSNDVV